MPNEARGHVPSKGDVGEYRTVVQQGEATFDLVPLIYSRSLVKIAHY